MYFWKWFQDILGESRLKEGTQDLGNMLMPSGGSQSIPALCRHKCTFRYTLTHTSKYTQLFSTHTYTHTPPPSQKNVPGEDHFPFYKRLAHPLPHMYLTVTTQGRLSCIAFSVSRREHWGPRNHGRHCGSYSKWGKQVSKPLPCPASCSDMTCRYPHGPLVLQPERNSQLLGLRVAFRDLLDSRPDLHRGGRRRSLPGSSVCVVGMPVPSPEHLPADSLGPKRMFSPIISHWAPQPSHGGQRMSFCDPISVWRSVPQHVRECVYMSVCVWACACRRVCAGSRDCRGN